jgi:hypothetical protein
MAMPLLGIFALLISLSFALYTIFQKNKHTENARIKIAKDILIFLNTFLLILFISGVLGLLVNFYVSNLYGAVIGLLCAILVSFAVGYWVRKVITKLQRI